MNQATSQNISPTKRWLARLQLLALFAIFMAPVVGAYYMYAKRDQLSLKTVNSGQLYRTPQDLAGIDFQLAGGAEMPFSKFEKKWYLLVIADGACEATCEKNLLTIRQLRRMQGKNVNRVVSILVHRNLSGTIAGDLAAKYSIQQVTPSQPAVFDKWLEVFYGEREENEFDASRIYVVDPLKNLMMSYPSDVDPKAFYKDLKRLLKVSQVG